MSDFQMGRRLPHSQNKLVVVGIFSACCFALYCLVLKVNRLFELAEMDRMASAEATITTIVYLNSTFSADSSASVKFLFHSQTEPPVDLFCDSRNPVGKLTSPVTTQLMGPGRIFLGTCDVLEPGFSIELKNQEFSATLDPDLVPVRRRAVVCLSLAFLFEDVGSLKGLLKHYAREADIVEVYVSCWHDSAHKVAEKYPNVHLIWWPLLPSSRRAVRDGRIQLDADSYHQTVEASFGDCWLRNAPLVETISLVEVGKLDFATGPKREYFGAREEEYFREEWRLKTLVRGHVDKVEDHSLTVAESCSGHCGTANPAGQKATKLTKKTTTLTLPRSSPPTLLKNSYTDDVKRCTSFRGYSQKARRILERSAGFDKIQDPCLLRSQRDGHRCRTASQTAKRMFSGDIKVSVVQKRSMLRFNDGCH